MVGIKKRLNELLVNGLWSHDLSTLRGSRAMIVRFFRLSYVAFREFSEGQLTLRAMGLVYTTLLSLVPLLAVSFSVLKAFGVHNQVEPALANLMAPLGPKGAEITTRIISFVENIQVGVLGAVGLALLLYTVISLVQKIEEAFNHIWTVRKGRSLARRVSDYMSVILVGPVLVFAAVGLTATIMSSSIVKSLVEMEPLGTLVYFLGKVSPYLIMSAAFTFIYVFVPNVKVQFSSALTGGLFAGILWQTTGWLFASFVVSSTRYAAIYSGFAILVLFMIWLYLSWLILFVGAKVSFYHQYPQFLNVRKDTFLMSNRLKERLAFAMMYLIAERFRGNQPPWTMNGLVERFGLPMEPIQEALGILERRGFVVETCDEPCGYIPRRDLQTIGIGDFLEAVRTVGEEGMAESVVTLSVPQVDGTLQRIDAAVRNALGGETLLDLVSTENARTEEAADPPLGP